MTAAKTILKMIEWVDPADNSKLHEIDAHFWAWYRGDKFCIAPSIRYELRENVTGSRDALKSIRPDGWTFDIYNTRYNGASCEAQHLSLEDALTVFDSRRQSSEELAELHAVVQAIDFMRTV